jgi:hypothetical protein
LYYVAHFSSRRNHTEWRRALSTWYDAIGLKAAGLDVTGQDQNV